MSAIGRQEDRCNERCGGEDGGAHQIFPVLRGQALLQADDPLAASLVCVVLSVQHRDFACSRIKIEKNREGEARRVPPTWA